MIPTEHEYTVATHAAAERIYTAWCARMREIPDWDSMGLNDKRPYLERVLPIVDAAISAIPDRLDQVRHAFVMADEDPAHPGDDDLLATIRKLVGMPA